MSLINQMLRDLEARQVTDTSRHNGIFDGLNIGTAPRRRSPLLLPTIIVVLAGIVGAAAWFGIDRFRHSGAIATAPGASPHAAPVPAVVGTVPRAPLPQQPSHTHSAPVTPATNPTPIPKISPLPEPRPRVVTRHGGARQSIRTPRQALKTRQDRTPKETALSATSGPSGFVMRRHVPTVEQQSIALYQQALGLLRQRDNTQAEIKLREALRLTPGKVQVSETLAALLINEGRVVEAAPIIDAARRRDGNIPTLDLLAARIQLAQGDVKGATATLQNGLSAANNQPDYLALLAALYQKQNKYGESIQAYQRALELNPTAFSWWAGLGISEEGAGTNDAAIKAYERSLQGALPTALRDYVQQRLAVLKTRHSTDIGTDNGQD